MNADNKSDIKPNTTGEINIRVKDQVKYNIKIIKK